MGSFGSILDTHQDFQSPPHTLLRVRTYSSPYTFCLLTKSNHASPYIIHPLPPVLPPRIMDTHNQRPIVPIALAKSIHMMDEPARPPMQTTVLSILQESTKA